MERPATVTEEHLNFLDNLRESGITNMFGAPSYVEEEFGVGEKESSKIVSYWMTTFGDGDR